MGGWKEAQGTARYNCLNRVISHDGEEKERKFAQNLDNIMFVQSCYNKQGIRRGFGSVWRKFILIELKLCLVRQVLMLALPVSFSNQHLLELSSTEYPRIRNYKRPSRISREISHTSNIMTPQKTLELLEGWKPRRQEISEVPLYCIIRQIHKPPSEA